METGIIIVTEITRRDRAGKQIEWLKRRMNNLDKIEAWRLFLEEFGQVAG
jgi:hypothetical protein